jgi:hypothetical protein
MQITLIWTLYFTVGFEATTVHIGGNARWRHGKAVTSRLRCQPPGSVAATPQV